MRLPKLTAAALVLLTAGLTAQGQVRPHDPADAWARFLRDNGPEWTAQWSPATGTPKAIWGTGLKVKDGPIPTLAEARGHAVAALDRHADLLGRGTSTFVEEIAARANRVFVFVYGQRFQGLEVIGGRADVRVHDTGAISMLGSEAFAIPAGFDLVPAIGVEAARQTAHDALGLVTPLGPLAVRGRLVIFGDHTAAVRQEPRLAWEIAVDQAPLGKVGRSYVDAKKGTVLGYVNDYHECFAGCSHAHAAEPEPLAAPLPAVIGNVKAWTNVGLKPTDPLVNVPVQNALVTVVGGGTGYTDASGNFSIPHTSTAPVQVVVEFKGTTVGNVVPRQGTKLVSTTPATPDTPVQIQIYTSSVSDLDFSQSTGYWGTDFVNRYLTAINGPLPSRIHQVTVYTSLAQTCNAHYTGNTINFYSAGGGCNMTCYSTVIFHEWGHGIDDAYGGISQTDGLSEGWGDLIATYASDQPIVGDAFRTTGGYIRTALNTYTYPAGTEVHLAGQTWMGWAWDVRTNLQATKGTGPGKALAEKIVLPSLAANARNQPDAVREVFIVDDDDSNLLNGTPNYLDLEKAALKRKLPYPVRVNPNAGSWQAYGAGCKGSGKLPAVCHRMNDTGTNSNATTRANLIYALKVTAPTTLAVNGFELNTSSSSGNQALVARLYSANASGQPDQILATGTLNVGTALAWYPVTFAQPVAIPGNQTFFIAFVNAASPIRASTMASGTQVEYFRNDGLNGAWNGPLTGFAWGYRISCPSTGGAVPQLANSGVPEIGTSFDLKVGLGAASAPAIWTIGASNAKWGALNLPFDLAGLGAAGCSVLASAEMMLALPLDANGGATLKLGIPNDTNLFTVQFYNQVWIVDAAANNLGLAFTNGGAAKIGKGL